MPNADMEPSGTYRIPLAKKPFTRTKVIDGVIPESLSSSRYGWIQRAFPAPDSNGCYIVEFVGRRSVRILGFMIGDRVFKTNHVSDSSFGDTPDLRLAWVPPKEDPEDGEKGETADDGLDYGYVWLRDGDGLEHRVAKFSAERELHPPKGPLSLFDSWVNLGLSANGDVQSEGMNVANASARCFLAFVVRPDLGGGSVARCGLDGIDDALHAKSPIAALRKLVSDVSTAELDEAMTPPALARFFARWLVGAGIEEMPSDPDSYRPIVTPRYSDLCLLLPATDEAKNVSHGVHNAVEAAINMYRLVKDALGGNMRAFDASMEDVSKAVESVRRLDPYSIVGTFQGYDLHGKDVANVEKPSNGEVFDKAVGEWDWRSALPVMIGAIPALNRIEAEFRGNLKSGIVSIASVAPSVSAMPKHRWDEDAGEWVECSDAEREEAARSYAIVIATTVVACAFASSPRIGEVRFSSAFVENDGGYSVAPVCRIVVSREEFLANDRYRNVGADPLSVWLGMSGELLSARFNTGKMENWDGVREYLGELVGHVGNDAYRDYPEIADGVVADGLTGALHADYVHDMRISYDALHRRNAELLADELVKATSDLEAVKIARSHQAKVTDPFDDEALTRVMGAIVQGALDIDDQNDVVNCYLGEDRFITALAYCKQSFLENPKAGLSHILDLIDEVEASGEFADDLEVVHRYFDSYTSRLVYNAIREGARGIRADLDAADFARQFDFGADDDGKSVELVPSSLLSVYVTAAYYLEQSFDGFDRAAELAKRAIKMAPTVVEGYRQLARAHILVGDAEAAADVLKSALLISVSPGDVGLIYYQLGYALWKMGSYEIAAICYMKAAEMSPQIVPQAMSELRELARESGITEVSATDFDAALREAGIPVAPLESVVDTVMLAAHAATDMGMFDAAREMLVVGFMYRPDDALVNVIRSLADD